MSESQPTTGILTNTAKALGTAAGKIAALAGASEPAPVLQRTKSAKPEKLAKKHNPHLPRRQKKAAKKLLATS